MGCKLGWTAVDNDVPIPVLNYYKNRNEFKGSIDLRYADIFPTSEIRGTGTRYWFNLKASQYLSSNQKPETWSFEAQTETWRHETIRDEWFEEIKAMKATYWNCKGKNIIGD